MTPSVLVADLLGAAVRVGSVRVGELVGVFVDRTGSRAIGLEITGPGGVRRFLPWVAARFVAGEVALESPLLLVDDGPSYERLGARAIRDPSVLRVLGVRTDGRLDPGGVAGDPVSSLLATGTAIR